MKLSVQTEILKKVPGMQTGFLVARGVRFPTGSAEIESFLQEQEKSILEKFVGQDVKQIPEVVAWRKAFEAVGQSARKFPCSLESSLRRLLKGQSLPRINPLVDFYNAMTLKYLIPMGAYDLGRVEGDELIVRFSQEGDTYIPLGQPDVVEQVPEGEVVFAHAHDVMCRAWTWRQSDSSKITPQSTDLVFRIEALAVERAILEKLMDDLADSVSRLFGGETAAYIIDENTDQVQHDFGKAQQTSKTKVVSQDQKKLIDKFFERGIAAAYPSEQALRKALASGKRLRFYIGVDPSGPQITLGHAVPIWRMKILQDLGHEIIFLIGDFTGRIGDPTDRSAARVKLTHEEVLKNAETYKEQVSKILNFEGPNPAVIKFNSHWNDKLGFADVIELAAHFTVQQMIERDMYQKRIKEEKPIYLHEFLYPLMQAYDTVSMDVDGEFGGTDQTFNMLAGRTLMKAIKDKEKYVVACELLVGSDGLKMSKSFHNFIPIEAEPADMYGGIMSVRDDLIGHYFRLCTQVDLSEIEKIEKDIESDSVNPRDPKMRLAREIVSLYCGEKAASVAEHAFIKQFQQGGLPDYIEEKGVSASQMPLASLLVELGLAGSKGEAKRLIKQGGVRIDGEKVKADVSQEIFLKSGMIIQVGKLRFIKLKLND